MNRKILLLILLLTPPWQAWAQADASLCPTPLNVGFNDWAPYSWTTPQGEVLGLDVEMLSLIARQLGCRLNFIKMPAKRAHQMLQTGMLDIIMGASYTDERANYAYFSNSYRSEEVKLFVKAERAEQINVEKWQDIFSQQLKLLAPFYGWYGPDYQASKDALSHQGLLVLSPNTNQSIQMLAYDRGDILIGDAMALPYTANQSHGVVLSPLSLLVDSNQIHFMFSKQVNHLPLVSAINQAIDTLSHQGALAKVMMKWQQTSLAHTQEHTDNPPTQPESNPRPDGALIPQAQEIGLTAANSW